MITIEQARINFESILPRGADKRRNSSGDYVSERIDMMWGMWLACGSFYKIVEVKQ